MTEYLKLGGELAVDLLLKKSGGSGYLSGKPTLRLRRTDADRAVTRDAARPNESGSEVRYVGKIEGAKVSASVTVLGRLAQALGVDPCDLIRVKPRP